MKKLISLITLLCSFALTTQAGVIVQSMATATNYVAFTNALAISSITVIGPSTGVTLKLFDQDDGTTNLVNAAYVTYSSYMTNEAQNVVTTTGITNYMTNSYLWTYATTNAAATNGLPILAALVAPNATPVTFPFNGPLVLVKGLTIACTSSNTTAIINYYNPFPTY